MMIALQYFIMKKTRPEVVVDFLPAELDSGELPAAADTGEEELNHPRRRRSLGWR